MRARFLLLVLAAVLCATTLTGAASAAGVPLSIPAQPAAPSGAVTIVDYEVEFTVENRNRTRNQCSADGQRYTIRGHLTAPGRTLSLDKPPVSLMVHGTNTGEWIWRIGAQGAGYAQEMAVRGHATVTIDRLGYGRSDIPDGFASCSGAHADMAHQITQQLRTGDYVIHGREPVAFHRIVLGGHSSGALVAETAAVSFAGAADGLLLTGWAAVGITDETNRRFLAAYRRCLSGGEQHAGPGSPGGYVHFDPTLEDFLAGGLSADADPAITTQVEGLWPRNPCGVMLSEPMGILQDLEMLHEIDVPVQLIFGARDTLRQGVEGYPRLFTGSPQVDALTLPRAGHFVTCDVGAQELFDTADAWLDQHAPAGG